LKKERIPREKQRERKENWDIPRGRRNDRQCMVPVISLDKI